MTPDLYAPRPARRSCLGENAHVFTTAVLVNRSSCTHVAPTEVTKR